MDNYMHTQPYMLYARCVHLLISKQVWARKMLDLRKRLRAASYSGTETGQDWAALYTKYALFPYISSVI